MKSSTDVAVVGAGPYGLALASHLRRRNVTFRIFGSPMRTWIDMPKGTALKSFDFATNIYTAEPHRTFIEYCHERGLSSRQPVDMRVFAAYGLWVQRELVPEVEDVQVTDIARATGEFTLRLANGEHLTASRVVVAVGLKYFERLPAQLAELPRELVSHTSWHADYAQFGAREVAVVGAGQSALEAAALLAEHGATVRLLVRGEGAWFADDLPERRAFVERIRYPQSVMGPGRLNWVLEHAPWLIHFAPEHRRVRFTRRHLGPFGTHWLRATVEQNVAIHARTTILSARAVEGGVALIVRTPEGDREMRVDHVVAGTGYEVDVDRLSFIDRGLASSIARVERAPKLDRRFQSSVPGLYFIGPAAAYSFGPLLRFVCGAAYAAPTVAGRLAASRGAARSIEVSRAQA